MATKKAYEEYLDEESTGMDKQPEPEVTGILVDLKSPAEQDKEEITEVTLKDETVVEVPTGWLAVVVNNDGEELTWRWPGHLVDGKSKLGVKIIPKEHKLRELFKKTAHYYRDGNNRAHIDFVE